MFTSKIIWNQISFYDLFLIFYIYMFFGWCIEVIHSTLKTGKFTNRGFLNGPICPIYGVGVCIVVTLLTPFKNNVFILFFASLILTSILEFIVGFVLEKIFRLKWWDYSKEHFHIKGYVCLKYSIYWGLACVLVFNVLQVYVMKVIGFLPIWLGISLICLFSLTLIVDLILTILQLKKYNERIKELNELTEKFRIVSDNLGEKISSLTLKIEKSRLIKAFPLLKQKTKKNIKEENDMEGKDIEQEKDKG